MTQALEALLRERLGALDLDAKVRLLTGADFWALHDAPAAGLRRMVTSDGPVGVRGERWDEREPSANLPSPTALAATWDEERIERLGRLLAAESRRKGVDVLLAPTVNLHRTPYGGRHFECFSEDPLLTARIGAAYVRGVQAEGVAATVKHFVANDSETERFTVEARVGERALRELYLAPFEAIVREASAWAVMAAYNAVNGPTMTESPMLQDILRDEWGFDGVVMSDWGAARTTEGAGAAALDLAMPGPDGPWGDALAAAVRDGRVPEADIDEKVLRLLRLGARVGALDGVAPAAPPAPPWPEEDVAAELRGAAAAGIVLARNERGVLPLDAGALRRVAVLGPNAAVARTLGGGSATVFPARTVSPLEGLRAALGAGVTIDHAAGVRAHTRLPIAAPELRPDGVEVRFLGADGAELGREHRDAAQLTWLGRFTAELPREAVAAVELRTRLRAAESGEHVVGVSAVGGVQIELDGAQAWSGRLELPAGADLADAVMAPPQHGVAVTLAAGQALEVVIRHDVEPGIETTALRINADPPHPGDEAGIQHAVELAAAADVAIVVVGTTEEVEREGVDRDSLELPGRQDELVRRVAAANPRTVVVVNAGAPVLLPWAEDVAAVLLGWFGGQEFGAGLADVLLGAAEPGGRLPTTWPATADGLPSTRPQDGVLRYDEGLFVGYRAFDRDGRRPRYPFGHGLGYTAWEYLEVEAVPSGEDITVRVRLRNAGDRPGREVVQVYAACPGSELERPPRWLAGLAAVTAGPGEEVMAEVAVPARALAHWDPEAEAWAIEAGTFVLAAGRSSRDLRGEAEVTAVPGALSP